MPRASETRIARAALALFCHDAVDAQEPSLRDTFTTASVSCERRGLRDTAGEKTDGSPDYLA
jgi:hypothetical protein